MADISCHVVGIGKIGNEKIYDVLVNSYNPSANPSWQISIQKVKENVLKSAMASNKVKVHNAKIVNGGLVGTTGSLDRFTPKIPIDNAPIVIIAELKVKGSPDRLIGYKVASREGKVKNIRAYALINYCTSFVKKAEAANSDAVPIQNYIFDPARGVLRPYEQGQSIVEYLEVKRPANAKPAQIDQAHNKRQLSKLEEIFNKDQIQQLKLGKAHGVDIKVYGNAKLSADQMKVIREALEDGIDPRPFADPAFKADAMKAYRFNCKYGVNISDFINPSYDVGQIYELSTAWLEGIDISKLSDPKLSADDMAKIRIDLETKLYDEVQVSVIDIINRY